MLIIVVVVVVVLVKKKLKIKHGKVLKYDFGYFTPCISKKLYVNQMQPDN